MEASTTAPSEGRAAPAPAAGFVKRSKDRGNVRKRGAEEPAEVEEPAAVERRAKVQKDAPMAFSTKANEQGRGRTFRYESSRTLQQVDDQGATAALETETAFDRDARYAASYAGLGCKAGFRWLLHNLLLRTQDRSLEGGGLLRVRHKV